MAALDDPLSFNAGLVVSGVRAQARSPKKQSVTNPFKGNKDDGSAASSKDYVHIRVQQRNGRKSLTTVQGINATYDKKKILKALKKEYCCNGTVVEDEELGQVIQVQGDQRKNIADFLTNNKIVKKDMIKVHGF